jgi:Plant transposon protein
VLGKDVFLLEGTKDALGNPCIHPLVRLTAVFRTLAYGSAFDSQDENPECSTTTVVNDAIKSFCKLMIKHFGKQYLIRTPTQQERRRILKRNEERGFPGCFASWDCKHFVWDKCPVAKQGQHKGHADGGKHTKILEAIADDSCFFWFVNFGDPRSCNDINVLDKSSIVGALINGTLDLKTKPYQINGTTRDWMYFLADGIYPNWAVFVKTIPKSTSLRVVLRRPKFTSTVLL